MINLTNKKINDTDNNDLTRILYNQNKFEIISISQNFKFICSICNKIHDGSLVKVKFLNDGTEEYLKYNFNQVFLPLVLNTEETNIYTLDQKVYTLCNICYSEFINVITLKQLDGLKQKN